MQAPFPYPGGKRDIAPVVWQLLGQPNHYIEPFAGSAAVLLARLDWAPGKRLNETLNDGSARIAHLWRAIKLRPDEVTAAATWPSHEIDYHARHAAVLRGLPDLRAQMLADPAWCDPVTAGWELWGLSLQIGQGWMKDTRLGARPTVFHQGCLAHGFTPDTLRRLADRLAHVSTLCGDWERCVASKTALKGAAIDEASWTAGVFLDPPYTPSHTRAGECPYSADPTAADRVRAWCIKWGHEPRVRIVLAGLPSEHGELEAHGWRRVEWMVGVGMSSGGYARKSGEATTRPEALWASPHCLALTSPQLDLLGGITP